MRRAVRQPTCFSSREPDIQVMHTSNPVLISISLHKSSLQIRTIKAMFQLQQICLTVILSPLFSSFVLNYKTSLFFTIQTQPRPRLHLRSAFSQADTCSTRQAVACIALPLTSTCDLSNVESRPDSRDLRHTVVAQDNLLRALQVFQTWNGWLVM